LATNRIETDIQLHDHAGFTRRADIIKKISVLLIALIVLAGLAGLFGYAKWTRTQKGDGTGFYIEYERFLRARKETPLKIVAPPAKEVVSVFVEQKYFDLVSFQRISPTPSEVVCDENGYTFYFPSEGKSLKHLHFTTVAKKMGCIRSVIRSGKSEMVIEQIIYP
jgi:hypothetical protein